MDLKLLESTLAEPGGQVRHVGVGVGAARGPLPYLSGAEARLAAISELLLEQLEIHPFQSRTAISAPSAKGGTSSMRSPLQNRPGSYQLAGRRPGSSPMCW